MLVRRARREGGEGERVHAPVAPALAASSRQESPIVLSERSRLSWSSLAVVSAACTAAAELQPPAGQARRRDRFWRPPTLAAPEARELRAPDERADKLVPSVEEPH